MLVAGDVGGTKTLLALFDGDPVRELSYSSAAYPSLEALLDEFLDGVEPAPSTLSLALAGPVRGGRAQVTNLGWSVDATALRDRYGFERVRLINDVAAIRDAIPTLPRASAVTLQVGEPEPGGTIAVVAPGTGLGFAASGIASEGGHASFAPVTEQQAALASWMRKERGCRATREDVCSGRGLPFVHAFLRSSPGWSVASAVSEAPAIIEGALADRSGLCAATVELFVEMLGAIAGDWALEVTARGGLYLAGGLPTRVLPYLLGDRFLEAFRAKDPMGDFLRAVPVHLVTDHRVALRGARLQATVRDKLPE